MHSKAEPSFQAVALSDTEDVGQHHEQKRRFYTPTATRPPVVIGILCFILACIALLQVAVSKSSNEHTIEASTPAVEASTHALNKRQTIVSTDVFAGALQTETAQTITWSATTATFPTITFTYLASTQTITGTTETFPGHTQYIYASVDTISGTPVTVEYELSTTDGTVRTVPLVSATPPSAYLHTDTPTTAAGTSATAPSVYLQTDTPTSSVMGSATPPSVYLDTSIPSGMSSTPTYPPPEATPGGNYLKTLTASINLEANPTGVIDIAALPSYDRVLPGTYSTSRYFAATYLCSLLVVLLKCVWGVVYASVKMVEPFNQLSQPNGADLRSSLLADYLSSSISVTALTSLFTTSRPVMLLTTLITALTTALAPVAAEAMTMKASAMCQNPDGSSSPCSPVWLLNVTCARVLQAIFSLMFCLMMAYLILSRNRHSGIFSNPSSIASVASLMGNRNFVQELRSIPANASKKDIRKLLKGNRYALATFPTDTGESAYGIVKVSGVQIEESFASSEATASKQSQPKKSKLLNDIVLLVLSAGILAIVLAYDKDMAADPFNNFFNSNSFGPRFVLSALATLLDQRWKQLEREARMIQPYRRLHQPSKASARAILNDAATTSYTNLPTALLRGDFFLALVALTAVLGDVLIIAVTGVPFADGQLYANFQVSTWLSAGILCLMVVMSIAVMIWRRGNPHMPRQPSTVISVATYLCASQVTEQLVPFSTTSEKTRDRIVSNWGQRYWFGTGLGKDDRARWMVDTEIDGSN